MMNIKEQILEKANNRPSDWRFGQAVFNYAYELYPKETDSIRFSGCDCFYNDRIADDFLNKLEEKIKKAV